MKISKIEIKAYQQFKDVEFDFTYPDGHKLAGKPLQKICFIGQSGTGKTTLLRLIKFYVARTKRIGPNLDIITPNSVNIFLNCPDLSARYCYNEKSFTVTKLKFKNEEIEFDDWLKKRDDFEGKYLPRLINYPAEVIRGKNFDKQTLEDEEVRKKKIDRQLEIIDKLEPQGIVDFAVEEIETIRNYVFKEIKEHRAKELLYKNEISEIILKDNTTPDSIAQITKDYEIWLKNNINPLTDLAAKCLDPILAKFGLKVKTQIDLDTILALGDIQLQTLEGVDVDRPFWSTGTRHLVDTIMPLYELKPKQAIVLMDEPEKSLFPDMQEMIVDFYVNMNPSCQYFFATHSPIIAGAFDPWEVFHLEYDAEGKAVSSIKNYDGNRHVDNYNYYPKYLKWNDILTNVFQMEEEGGSERIETLLDVATKFKELNVLKAKGKDKTIAYKKKKDIFLRMAKKVGWRETNI
jgi:energy-coupling factor transporter ATP-binding protein EcfA2